MSTPKKIYTCTHGLSGYASDSYWDGEDIICGECGARITNPPPTGYRFIPDKGIRGWLGKGKRIPTWPDWIEKR